MAIKEFTRRQRAVITSTAATSGGIVLKKLAPDAPGAKRLSLGIVAVLFLGAFALWVAFYGAGRARSMSDDREIHAIRKARYKWWS